MNRIYAKRKHGGRGLKSIEDLYECRNISLMEHLYEAAEGHELLSMARKHEENGIVRLGREFKTRITELSESSNVEGTKKIQKEVWIQKEAHGYHQKQIESQDNIGVTKSNNWLSIRFTSHIERFICSMQEQEIDTRGLTKYMKRREKDVTKKKSINKTCRICKRDEESLFHLLCSCSVLAPTLYLTVRHNQVARIIYQELINHDRVIYKPTEVTRTEDKEIWWDVYVATPGKVEHNRPDMVLWDLKTRKCTIIEISMPLDTNLELAYKSKQQKYMSLVCQLQQLYRRYTYSIIVITVGALGAVPKNLEENLQCLGMQRDRIQTVINTLQRAALLGSVKICKTVLKCN